MQRRPMQSRHVSRVIAASPHDVIAIAGDPARLPSWAAGLAQGEVELDGDAVRVASPMGTVTVTFVDANDLGVLDHAVRLPDGATVRNPMRVVEHPDGAEIIVTVRQLDMGDEELDRDAAAVARDLDALAALVEGREPT